MQMSAVEHMVAAYEAGVSVTAVAAEHGISSYRVYQTLKEAGARMRRRGPIGVIDHKRAQVIAEMYIAGATMKQLGARYGVTRQRVRQILIRLGVERRSRHILRSRHNWHNWQSRHAHYTRLRPLVLAAYEAGETMTMIARKLDVSRPWVRRVLKAAGCPPGSVGDERRAERCMERQAKLRELFDAGLEVDQIAAHVGLTRGACYAALRRAGRRYERNRQAANA